MAPSRGLHVYDRGYVRPATDDRSLRPLMTDASPSTGRPAASVRTGDTWEAL